jgi:transcriptional regulator with XRE-family HTH domain
VPVEPESLAVVVGRNCQLRRKAIGITQDDLARYARDVGLHWTASKVGDFEAGRRAPTFATVLTVLLALNCAAEDAAEAADAEAQYVRLSDLVAVDGLITLTDTLDVKGGQLAGVCRGDAFVLAPITQDAILTLQAAAEALGVRDIAKVLQRHGLTEYRLAKALGVEPVRLAQLSFQLWQRTFSEERDRRAGPEVTQQKKGRISRELRAELEKEVADGNNQ